MNSIHYPIRYFLLIPFPYFHPNQHPTQVHPVSYYSPAQDPKLTPSPPPQAQPGQPAPQRPPPALLEKLSKGIHLWVKGNYDSAMRFVAYAEMAILARSILGALTYVLHHFRRRYKRQGANVQIPIINDYSPFSSSSPSTPISRLAFCPRGSRLYYCSN